MLAFRHCEHVPEANQLKGGKVCSGCGVGDFSSRLLGSFALGTMMGLYVMVEACGRESHFAQMARKEGDGQLGSLSPFSDLTSSHYGLPLEVPLALSRLSLWGTLQI